MPEHQPVAGAGRFAVLTGDDVLVGTAHPDGDPVDQQLTRAGLRFGHLAHLE